MDKVQLSSYEKKQETPNIQLGILVNKLKTVSSRLIRRDFKAIISKVYRQPVFWHRSYCIVTSRGSAT
jgi:putative transposase